MRDVGYEGMWMVGHVGYEGMWGLGMWGVRSGVTCACKPDSCYKRRHGGGMEEAWRNLSLFAIELRLVQGRIS
jgi:hypothetical protein